MYNVVFVCTLISVSYANEYAIVVGVSPVTVPVEGNKFCFSKYTIT
jgi:hypothetical protein